MKYKVNVRKLIVVESDIVEEVVIIEANSVEEAEEQTYYTFSEDVEIVSVKAVGE